MTDINEVLRHFRGVRRGTCSEGIRESYTACCPCHNDKQQSLGISLADSGKILLNCFAGCDTEGILQAAGLTFADIGSEQNKLTCLDRLLYGYSKKHGEGVKITDEYQYRNERGKYLYSKLRIEGGDIKGKLIRYYKIDRIADTCEKVPEGQQHVLYRLPEFLKCKDKAQNVFIVEGEKDVETLRKLGNGFGCATTAGGASDWKKDYARYFKSLNVVILRDNDKPGAELAEQIRKDLRPFAYSVKVVAPSSRDKGDVTDYITEEGGSIDDLKTMIAEAKEYFAPWVNPEKKKINTGLLAETVRDNEHFIIIRNPTDDKDAVYLYVNGVYKLANKQTIAAIIRGYLPAAKVTTSVINDVMSQLTMTLDNVYNVNDLNTDERYINFHNGLYDITTKKLIPHDPYLLSTFQFDFDYEPGSRNKEAFTKYMKDFCTKPDGTVDYDQMKVLQEYTGFMLSNVSMKKIKKALVLLSALGNSGKSVFIRLISSFYGIDKVAPIKLTELTPDNKFILGTLPYSRLIVCDDESNTTVNDSSLFKAITGGGILKVEAKNKQAQSLCFNGGFMFACNGLPYFADDKGEHLFNRLLIIPCDHHIMDAQKDAGMDEKLQRELPAIMNWAIEGLHRLIEQGYTFTESEAVNNAREEYRKASDTVYRYIIENYEITQDYDDKVSRTTFDRGYTEWAKENEIIEPVKKKNLPLRLASFGITYGRGNLGEIHNVNLYHGLKERERHFSVIKHEVVPFA